MITEYLEGQSWELFAETEEIQKCHFLQMVCGPATVQAVLTLEIWA